MATITISYGTRAAFPTVSNLTSLANNAAKPLGKVDNSAALADDYKIDLKITLAAASVTATGTVEVYLLEAAVDTSADYTDAIDPAGTSDVASSLKNARLLAIYNANAVNQVIRDTFDLSGGGAPRPVTNAPKYFTLVVKNLSGAAFAASGNDAQETPVKYQST